MKKFYTPLLTLISLISFQFSSAQCTGVKGPNLLGAKGTFSAPFITVNNSAANCTRSGSASYNPTGNVGNALIGCNSIIGNSIPCSDYVYTSANGGLGPEFRYSILKTIGNSTGGNCIKGDWRGSDHTGDGGYFMAVNGAPNGTYSSIFYQIRSINVCVGATYEFSAWVINLLPSTSSAAVAGSEPSISFKVNGVVVGNSGPIPYTATPTWVKVGGSFTATSGVVDLQVVNATTVATGNDLGLDDISINVCQSQIAVGGPISVVDGNTASANFVVTDATNANTWYKWQKSIDGGASFTDVTTGAEATYVGSTFTLPLDIGAVSPGMNGYKYRLVVSRTQTGLLDPACVYFNDYSLIVRSVEAGPLPVKLTSFTGTYAKGIAVLNWQTSQEINSDHFELFRSYDAIDFVSVGKIASAGFSNTIKNYSFQDRIGGSNYVYYRLKQVDINGKETFSSIVKLALGETSGVSIFPNPFNNNFTVSIASTKTTSATLHISNSAGQLVFSKSISINKGNNSIAVTDLPLSLKAGVYYVSIVNSEINYNGKLQKL